MRRRWLPALATLISVLLAARPLWAQSNVDYDPAQTRAEIRLGRAAEHRFERRFRVIASGPAVLRLRRILKRLVPVSGRPGLPYTVKVVADPDVNAITFPGGGIYVFQGLLSQHPDDNMLACVLGHEVTHAARAHTYRCLLEMQALGLMTGGQDSLVSGMTKLLLVNGVGRTYEYQADRLGLHVAARAGYDPRAMLRVLRMLQRIEHERPGLVRSLVATHPPLASRIQRVRAELKAMGK